ncbi:MAG: hypothetical protein IAG13_09290, partial [Deltaproteobacteria bacterium]|nr:hypothetical protein [Nannocystaceae bacterium]
GRPPDVLVPVVEEAAEHIGELRVVGTEARLRPRGGRFVLEGVEPGGCVRWRSDFEALLADGHDRSIQRVGDSVMVRQSMWLLWPEQVASDAHPRLELRLPAGVRASVPWATASPGDRSAQRSHYVLDATASRWLGYTAFGELDIDRFERAGAEIEIVRLDQAIACDRAGVRRWIVDAVDAVAMLYGSYPREHLQVIVVPVEGGDGMVYFGAAVRGGGAGVYLLLDTDAAAERLPGGWTTVHELLHHGMPFVEDAWMAEGWVSYYTELMRTRAGHRSEAEGWHELAEAFARGREGVREATLQQLSDGMHETHAYQRVYWGGAAIAFEIDITLRRESDGARGLDDAMRHLRSCCGDAKRRVSADAMLAELDRWHGAPIFTQIAARHLAGAEFPDIAELYGRLGMTMGASTVTLDERHPAAAVRRAIMAPRAQPSRSP